MRLRLTRLLPRLLLLILAGAVAPGLAADRVAPRAVAFDGRTMGTTFRLTIVTADSAASVPAARAAQRALARVDSLMSNWTTTSEVARLNAAPAGAGLAVQPQVAAVLAEAVRVGRDSEGAFDITVEPLVRAWGFLGGRPRVPRPGESDSAFARVGWRHVAFDPAARTLVRRTDGVRIDLGGIAKGHGVDAAADSLAAHGVRNALVDVSGNMRALGASAAAPAWRIGVRDPRDRRPYFARLTLKDGEGVSTSGKYEQFVTAGGKTYGHILDPRSGQPAQGLIAVTVFAPTAMTADAWSTALFVLGPVEARRIARSRPDLAAILVEPMVNGPDRVWVEASLRDRFELAPEAAADFRIEFFE